MIQRTINDTEVSTGTLHALWLSSHGQHRTRLQPHKVRLHQTKAKILDVAFPPLYLQAHEKQAHDE